MFSYADNHYQILKYLYKKVWDTSNICLEREPEGWNRHAPFPWLMLCWWVGDAAPHVVWYLKKTMQSALGAVRQTYLAHGLPCGWTIALSSFLGDAD